MAANETIFERLQSLELEVRRLNRELARLQRPLALTKSTLARADAETVLDVVEEITTISPAAVLAKLRAHRITHARRLAALLLRDELQYGACVIGGLLARDTSTITKHYLQLGERLLGGNTPLRRDYNRARDLLRAQSHRLRAAASPEPRASASGFQESSHAARNSHPPASSSPHPHPEHLRR